MKPHETRNTYWKDRLKAVVDQRSFHDLAEDLVEAIVSDPHGFNPNEPECIIGVLAGLSCPDSDYTPHWQQLAATLLVALSWDGETP